MNKVYHENEMPQVDENGGSGLVPFYDKKERRFYWVPPMNKQNPVQQKRLAERLAKQVDAEGHTKYGRVSTGYRKSYLQTLRRNGDRHRTLPLNTGITIVISALGNKPLPDDSDKRQELFVAWIADMSEKFGGSHDYGGEHAGFKFPPKELGRNVPLNRGLKMGDVAERLALDLGDDWWFDGNENLYLLKMTHDEGLEYVKEHFVSRGQSEFYILTEDKSAEKSAY